MSMKIEQHYEKSSALCLIAVAAWCALIGAVLLPWLNREWMPSEWWFGVACIVNASVWWLILLWALHNVTFQLRSVTSTEHRRRYGASPPVAILYTTCDDFSAEALRTCCAQRDTYGGVSVYVLDDGMTVDPGVIETCRALRVVHIRRDVEGRSGYKAGNLNHAIREHIRQPWFLLVDADQRLPSTYLRDLVASADLDDERLGYVQAAQCSRDAAHLNPFQSGLSLDVSLFYARDLVARRRYGFVPLLGHGALVSRRAWEVVGGFPHVVSEDYAFALVAREAGFTSEYVAGVASEEEFPNDFGGFIVRLEKYAAATSELVRTHLVRFLFSRATWSEKWDLLMLLGWYLTLPLVVANSFLSAFVVHRLWEQGQPVIQPLLPYLYTWLTLTTLGVIAAVSRSVWEAVSFYLWAAAVYTAAIPAATLALLGGLFGRARFRRTPKNGDETLPGLVDATIAVLIGIAAILCSIRWSSPFTPYLLGEGVAFLAFPLFGSLHRMTLMGRLARGVLHLPGSLMLGALLTMWWSSL